jgi:hypothetical protein
MSPVIRMSDDVFRRLQRVSEPLVDTPSQVIDRILEHYERSAPAARVSRDSSSRFEVAQPSLNHPQADGSRLSGQPDVRLFIAPAGDANLRRTITEQVEMSAVEALLSNSQLEDLKSVLGNSGGFHCWALTESRRSVFDAMRLGDLVILITPYTAFTGKIQYKLINEKLGNYLWPSQPRLPWKFVYLLTDVRQRRIQKGRLNDAFGYKPSHVFPGVSRVRPEPLRVALDKYGTIEKLLTACAA